MFQIKGSAEFASRRNQIFNELNDLEERHDKWREEATSECRESKRIFKRPRLPVSLKRARQEDAVPDYIMNPHKWKKYSLADTPNVTEESNTAVALQFLQDRRKSREAHIVPDDMKGITYQKPAATQNEVADFVEQESKELPACSFTCASVHRMPELVVGEKRRKPAKSFESKAKVGDSVRLDHLEELDEEV